ncbi:MAG: AAA family ATPase [Acidimicrobiia bacterium]|nr:AAA family ATPase [Acidimicrobiia bacterium]
MDSLIALWDQVTGEMAAGRVVAVVGSPGVGKSALLTEFATTVAAHGRPSVRLVGRGGAFRAPMAAAAELAALLDPASTADDDVRREVDPMVAARLLGDLFERVGATGPLAVLVDDLHDLDPTSRTALHLALRSAVAADVLVVLAGRPTDEVRAVTEGFPTIELTGLERTDARQLLQASSPSPVVPEVLERLLDVADGNPLALRHLPGVLAPEHLAGTRLLPDPIPVAGDLRDVFAPALADLPAGPRELLELAAVAGDGSWVTLTTAAARPLDDDVAHLEATGLAALTDGRLVPVHPLLYSAAIAAMTPRRRRQLNQRLAALDVVDPEVRLLHRAHAVASPDDDLVDDLVAAARALRRRGAAEAAARLLDQAVLHTHDDDRRRHLRIEAAEVLAVAGAAGPARTRLADVRDEEGPIDVRTAAAIRLARLDALHGDPVGAWQRLTECAATAPEHLRADVHAAMCVPLGMLGLVRDLNDQAARAVATSRPGSTPWQVATVVEGHGLVAIDEGDGRRTLADVLPTLDVDAAVEHDPQFGLHIGRSLGIAELTDEAGAAMARLTARSRGEGARASLSMSFGALGELHIRTCRYDEAMSVLDEAIRLSFATGQRAFAPFWFALRARVTGVRGEHDAAAADLADGLRIADELSLVGARYFLASAAGLDALTRGADREAVERFSECQMFEELGGVLSPNLARWRADLVEAYARLGDAAGAEVALGPLRAAAERPGATRWTRASAARAAGHLAALADPTAARPLLEHAVAAYDPLLDRFDLARAQLALAEVIEADEGAGSARAGELRRTARYGFEVLGTVPWVERTTTTDGARGHDSVEGAAGRLVFEGGPWVGADGAAAGANGSSGNGSAPAGVDAVTAAEIATRLGTLTPSERQVLVEVSKGLTNQQVAAALHLSPKTVANQLSRVYRKLEVASRTEAARLYLTQR